MTRIVLDLRIQQQQRSTKSKTMPSSNLYSITGFFILSTTEDFVLNNFMCCEIILYITGFLVADLISAHWMPAIPPCDDPECLQMSCSWAKGKI